MSKDTNLMSRREILRNAGVAAAGTVTLGTSVEGFAAGQETIDSESTSGHYRKLTATEIQQRVEGNTIHGKTFKGNGYSIYFEPGGKAELYMDDRPSEQGRWSIDTENDSITSIWDSTRGGKPIVVNYHISKDEGHFIKAPLGSDSGAVFVLTRGRHAAFK